MRACKQESSATIEKLRDSRVNAEQRAATAKHQLRECTQSLNIAIADRNHAKECEARLEGLNLELELKVGELTSQRDQYR